MIGRWSRKRLTRRAMLTGAGAASIAPFAARVVSAAPPAEAVTPALIAAARREGKVAFYTAQDLKFAEAIAKAFEAAFPGIAVRVERSGAERVFSRIAQEYASNIRAVDVVNTSDAAHILPWKRNGWLAPYLPAEAAEHFPASQLDPDGLFVNHCSHLCVIAYNSGMVAAADAPKGFMDLLEPKWIGKLVKAHPGYSGTILTATFQIARDLGWSYFERLAQQKILQVQSASDPPKKIALGERPVMADGVDFTTFMEKGRGAPLEVVYPVEGAPLISNPNVVFNAAPNPNAARLLHSWMMSAAGQQLIVAFTGQYQPHRLVKHRPDRKPLAEIKTMREDPVGVEKEADAIKARYTLLFKV